MRKFLRYTLKGLAIFFGVLVLVYTIAYIYVVTQKKEIINQIKQEVADKLNGEVQIGDIGLGFLAQFPSISIKLENVSIRDTLFNQHKHPFFEARRVYASISVVNLIKKNNPLNALQIENANLYIYTDTSGYTNSYLLSPKSVVNKADQPPTAKTEIHGVKLVNVRLVLDDKRKGKLYDFEVNKMNCRINNTDSLLTLKTSNDILIHNFALNTLFGSYVRETKMQGNFSVQFNKSRKQLTFEDIEIRFKNHPFTFSGTFSFAQAPAFALKIFTKNINYEEAKTLLTPKISTSLSLVKIEKPVAEVFADISGPLNGGDPLVNISFKVADNNIQSPFASFSDCSFDGSFTNELIAGLPRKDPNSRLQFKDFKGTFEGLKINSQNIYIDNLVYPMINADIKTNFDLPQLNALLGTRTLDLHEGKGSLDLTYSGPLQHNSNRNTALSGKVSFSDGVIMYHPRNLSMTNVSGNIVFKKTDVYVTDFRGNVGGNKLAMNGSGKNLLALMNTSPGKIVLDWNIYSPFLNLNTLTALLKQRASSAKKSTGKSKLGSTAQNIDNIVDQANFRLDVKADKLTFDRFAAANVKASVGLINENWILNTVSLQHAGGSMAIRGNLIAKNSKYYGSSINVNMQNMDVNKVMYAFNDFGQDGISHENLRGKLTSTVNVTMNIDRDLKGAPQDIAGYVDFSLKQGALLNYAPLEKIQQVAFKKRNFSEVYFAELKDRIDIKNKEINLNRMEIQSTVLTLYVEGIYSIAGPNTDIAIQIPLSNLKKRDGDYTPENKGADSKAGASIFVRGRPGPDGNVQFKLDLFKKLRKKDKDKPTADSTQVKS
ncbi:AsmA-like C-terminal region-containing protein [Segetibacter sp.]|uniref:YhdP family protein n=1 Tax=Segetibacter sp. TaxID=2231182 RepID=UPI002624DA05|nr:AsmA-like C-terminal region-containing protein [Segetibacter sp.]MCW3082287.1 AsmA family protein [Segetibacter sp.]